MDQQGPDNPFESARRDAKSDHEAWAADLSWRRPLVEPRASRRTEPNILTPPTPPTPDHEPRTEARADERPTS
ncbi:MAG: hypothetical protein AAGB48_07550, partial [Planctomycetota bacterium]